MYTCCMGEGKILKSRAHLVLVVLAELLVGGLVQELVELGLVTDLELHEPSALEGGLVHESGVAVKVLREIINSILRGSMSPSVE